MLRKILLYVLISFLCGCNSDNQLPTLVQFPTLTATLSPVPSNTPTSTLTPTDSPTLTPRPTVTIVPTATITPTLAVSNTPLGAHYITPTEPQTTAYFAHADGTIVLACPEFACQLITELNAGNQVGATDTNVRGESFVGSTQWIEVWVNNQIGYIHSSLLYTNPYTSSGSSSGSSSSSTTGNTGSSSSTSRTPANCTEARAMGLSAAQAGAYSHLDRDKDGVACYGD